MLVSGVRKAGGTDALLPSDLMHLGSLTKAVTATMIGALVAQGRMSFDTTLAQAFPELTATMAPAYPAVTIRQLLTHSAGVSPYNTRQTLQPLHALQGSGTEQRYTFVQRVLSEPPRFAPGEKNEYSNAGAAIAGAAAERLTGRSYQQLVQDLVFTPLGVRAAVGNPSRSTTPQPSGHVRAPSGVIVEILPASLLYTTPPAIEPAGDLSLSPGDYGRFLQLHLRGLAGHAGALTAGTIQQLHQRGGAMGWSLMPRDDGESHEHTGSYGAFTAFVTLQPTRNVAVAAFTNIGGGDEREVLRQLALRIAAGAQ